MTTALRSFLQYARFRGEVTLDLAAAVPGRGQLVDAVDPPRDCGGSSPSVAGQH